MKAIVYSDYGGPKELKLTEIPKPTPGDDEVLIKVHAVSLNDWDFALLQGKPFINRIQNGLKKPRITILGSDIAGRIESCGKNIKKFTSGDEVYGDLSGTWGGLAEYVCARENSLFIKPNSMSYVDAASIPQAAMLAIQGLIDKGKIQKGEKILINGAGGGVGTFGVQIAKMFGAEVTGVDHTNKLDLLRSIGFDHVIDYTKTDFTRSGVLYDLILDVKTNRSITSYARVLNPEGRYVTAGGSIKWLIPTLLLQPFYSLLTRKKFMIVMLKLNKDLALMNTLFESGKIRSVIDGPYKMEDYEIAFQNFANATHKGKIVIQICSSP